MQACAPGHQNSLREIRNIIVIVPIFNIYVFRWLSDYALCAQWWQTEALMRVWYHLDFFATPSF